MFDVRNDRNESSRRYEGEENPNLNRSEGSRSDKGIQTDSSLKPSAPKVEPMISSNWVVHAGKKVVSVISWVVNSILGLIGKLLCCDNHLRSFENFLRMNPEDAQKALEKDPIGYAKLLFNAFKQDGGQYVKILSANKVNLAKIIALHSSAIDAKVTAFEKVCDDKNASNEERYKGGLEIIVGDHHKVIDALVSELSSTFLSATEFSNLLKAVADSLIVIQDQKGISKFIGAIMNAYSHRGVKGALEKIMEFDPTSFVEKVNQNQ